MFKEALYSKEGKRKAVLFRIPPLLVLLIAPLINYFVAIVIHNDWNAFILGLWVSLIVGVMVIFAVFTAYSRAPHQIIEINQNEFRYISVIGKEKTIKWSQIVKMGPISESPNDRYIIYNGNIFKGFTIDIREDWGKKLEQAWKEWKEKQNTSGELWREK